MKRITIGNYMLVNIQFNYEKKIDIQKDIMKITREIILIGAKRIGICLKMNFQN